MPRRAEAPGTSSMMDSATLRTSPSTTAAAKHSCSSCSISMVRLREGALPPTIGFRRLRQQDWERGQVAIPFDQRGGVRETAERTFVQFPYGGSDRAAMVVDQDAHAVGIVDAVPGEMQLLHRFDRQGLDPGPRIAAEVPAGH